MSYQPQDHSRRLILRTEETAANYAAHQADVRARKEAGETFPPCPICADTQSITQEYEYWVIMKNAFPYDRYFTKSDMLALKRHATEADMTPEERAELTKIKPELAETYDHILENLPKQQSIPGHYHVHLVTVQKPTT
jgi:diadenosine tetraphosphate (Ap4A) HIT family hydrolase